MKHNLYFYSFLILITSCSKEINQYRNIGNIKERTGKWVIKDQTEEGIYLSKGFYKNNKQVGTWKIYLNNKLVQKEKYKDSIIKIKTYYPNRKLQSKGNSKLISRKNFSHWYKTGAWKHFSPDGNLDSIIVIPEHKP